jgi:hypothetical protein
MTRGGGERRREREKERKPRSPVPPPCNVRPSNPDTPYRWIPQDQSATLPLPLLRSQDADEIIHAMVHAFSVLSLPPFYPSVLYHSFVPSLLAVPEAFSLGSTLAALFSPSTRSSRIDRRSDERSEKWDE